MKSTIDRLRKRAQAIVNRDPQSKEIQDSFKRLGLNDGETLAATLGTDHNLVPTLIGGAAKEETDSTNSRRELTKAESEAACARIAGIRQQVCDRIVAFAIQRGARGFTPDAGRRMAMQSKSRCPRKHRIEGQSSLGSHRPLPYNTCWQFCTSPSRQTVRRTEHSPAPRGHAS